MCFADVDSSTFVRSLAPVIMGDIRKDDDGVYLDYPDTERQNFDPAVYRLLQLLQQAQWEYRGEPRHLHCPRSVKSNLSMSKCHAHKIMKLAALCLLALSLVCAAGEKPTVILIMTDDQGYGDLACHGNPDIKTPELDRLAKESVSFSDFHVDSYCTPTRSALMTGRYSHRVGGWGTVAGRNMLRDTEVTMADVFRHNHYRTGIFGKWHLGTNYPYRPIDRGFEEWLGKGNVFGCGMATIPLGDGVVGVEAIVKELRNAGFNGPTTLEVAGEENVKRSAERLRQ